MPALRENAITLLSATTVSLTADADTILYTVPTDKVCLLSHAYLVAAAGAGSSNISIGQDGAETDFIGLTNLTNLTVANDYVSLVVVQSEVPVTLKAYTAGTVLQMNVTNGAGGTGNNVYLFGVLYPA